MTSPAEALASDFRESLAGVMERDQLDSKELARFFMRNPDTALQFATCLHYYMTAVEQTRGGRNASYKQMNMVTTSKVMSYSRFGEHLQSIRRRLSEAFLRLRISNHNRVFDPLIVDWYAIAGQLPHLHRRFDDSAMASKIRGSVRPGMAPPWRLGR